MQGRRIHENTRINGFGIEIAGIQVTKTHDDDRPARGQAMENTYSFRQMFTVLMLGAEFATIQLELEQQKTKLENARKTGKLTKAEADLFSTLAQALARSQKKVAKEIVDVEDLVK